MPDPPPPRVADPNAGDYNLYGPPSISFAQFAKVFARHPDSPVWDEADPTGSHNPASLRPYWDKITGYGIDPLIALSFFAHESTLGTDAAIRPRHNWGNLKQGGDYETFATWLDGLDGWCRRFQRPAYAGRTTMLQIVPVYAPAFENPHYFADLIDNYIHPYLREDPQPVNVTAAPPSIIVPDPDYAVYANSTINLSLFREVLQAANSPALPEAEACFNACNDNGVNPAVALAFFALESSYGTTAGANDRKNWGNLSADGQLKSYDTWEQGLVDWGNHFKQGVYLSNHIRTISQIVPAYQPASAGGTVSGYNAYIQRLHDLIKGWYDEVMRRGQTFFPS